MAPVISALKPTIPKCVGTVLLAAAQYYGSAFVFLLTLTLKVLDEPARWTKLAEQFHNSGVNLEEMGGSFAQELFWVQFIFNLVIGYLIVALVSEWSVRRRDAERGGVAL